MTFAHIHTHTEFSALDGLSTCREIAARAAADGNPAVAATDHGNCASHPEFQRACDDAGVKPVFGMEAYFIPDRRERPAPKDTEAQARLRAYRHMILLARGQRGLRDLWAMSTESYLTGFYHKPRIDWELLEQYGSDLIATTGCLGGVIAKQLLAGRYEAAGTFLRRLHSLMGDRLYLEIQPIALPDQIRLNKLLVTVARSTGIPLVAAADSHYPSAAEHDLHRTWLACQTSPGNDDYWNFDPMHTEAELRAGLAYLGPQAVDEAVRNSVVITDQCDARIGGDIEAPIFLGNAGEDARVLYERCERALLEIPRAGGTALDYDARLRREWNLVASKQLAGCYLMVDDVCRWARSQGILVGPGRGSAAGSLMSYLLGITITDPLETGLMFERFLTPGRTALPDFDLDFPSSRRVPIQDYVTGRYGAEHVVRVGTHLRYRSKGVLNKLFNLHGDRLPEQWYADSRIIAGIIDEAESHTAGLGLPWADLMDQCAADLAPYTESYPQVFETASRLVGRLHAYGQHPAGLVISAGAPLEGTLPMRTPKPGDTALVSQWDFRDMEAQGLLKIDFLTLRTLDSIQEAVRLIERRTGQRLDPAGWRREYADPQVWEDIGSGYTAGLFQIETSLGRQACRRMRPESLAELADLITLVRPGPRNSGMAESYLRRRKGEEEVVYPHEDLQDLLKQHFGVMLYQEDILQACIILAGYDGAEADAVRKVLGKKLTEKIEEAGRKFVDRCEANDVPRPDAALLWEKMAEFGRYAFNLAHAYSYSILSFWTAWLKAHYPAEMLAAICTTIDDKDRIAGFVIEARRVGLSVLGPDVNHNAQGFEVDGLTIRYGLDAIKGVGPAALKSVVAHQPYTSYEAYRSAGLNAGITYALARAGALDSLVPSRRSLVASLDAERSGDDIRCVHKDDRVQGPNGLPCTYDWASEPAEIRISEKTGRELRPKPKPLPTMCWRACRQYTPPEAQVLDAATRYSAGELWRMEHDTFGTWISAACFERFGEPGSEQRLAARDIAAKWEGLPAGLYPLPGVIASRRYALTRNGSRMVWLSLGTESSYIDIAVFSPRGDDEPDLVGTLRSYPEGTIVLAMVARSAYRAKDGSWRMSGRLTAIERL